MFSQSSLDAPPSPPGFETRVRLNIGFPVNTLGVYVNGIDIMHGAVQNGWTEPFEAPGRSAYGVNMVVANTAPPPVANQLQNRHVILGLLQTIYSMIEDQRFCLSLAQILLYKEEIGVLTIESSARSDIMRNYGHSNGSLSTFSGDDLGRPGHIIDPDDDSFTIAYTYGGEIVASEDVFTSALDGLSDSALYANDSPCTSLYAASLTGKLVFGVRSAQSRTMPLSYFYARKTLKLLSFEMVARDKYGEVEFQLLYDGEQIGAGFVRLTPVLGNGTNLVATERRSVQGWGHHSVGLASRKFIAMGEEMSN